VGPFAGPGASGVTVLSGVAKPVPQAVLANRVHAIGAPLRAPTLNLQNRASCHRSGWRRSGTV